MERNLTERAGWWRWASSRGNDKAPPGSTLPRDHIASDVCDSLFRWATWTPQWSLLSGSGFPPRLLQVSTPQRNARIMCCTKSDALQQFLGRSEPVVLGAVLRWRPGSRSFDFLGTKTGVGGPGSGMSPGSFRWGH